MTQEEIIEMAKQCGIVVGYPKYQDIEAFAKLIAAKEQKKWEDQTAVEIYEAVLEEREACAKVCDEFNFGQSPMMIQRAIRARGEA